jgi:hypothetical protein
MVEIGGESGCIGEVGKARAAEAAGQATDGVSGAETNGSDGKNFGDGGDGSDGNNLQQAGLHHFRNTHNVAGARGGPGDSEAPGSAGLPTGYAGLPTGYAGLPTGYAGLPTGYAGLPTGYAGLPTGYVGQPAFPGFPGSEWAPAVQSHMYQNGQLAAAEAMNVNTGRGKGRRNVPQPTKLPAKRGHGSSHNPLNQKIREQMRKQQSKGTLVVKLEPKVRHAPRHNAPPSRKLAPNKTEKKKAAAAKGRGADVYLPPDTAARNAAIIMANTPGIVVAGSSNPLPKMDLESPALQQEDAWEPSRPTAIDSMETAARVAEALIGLRGAPSLHECLKPPGETRRE